MTIMRDWMRTGQTQPVPGVAANSPGNSPGPRDPSRLASGHAVTPSPQGGGVTDWNQCVSPSPFAVVQTQYGAQGALASSIEAGQGRVSLGLLDAAHAANPGLNSQFGPREPSGNPHMSGGQDRTAPSGHGQTGATPMRPGGMPCLTSAVGGQRSAGYTMYPRTAP